MILQLDAGFFPVCTNLFFIEFIVLGQLLDKWYSKNKILLWIGLATSFVSSTVIILLIVYHDISCLSYCTEKNNPINDKKESISRLSLL